MTDLNSSEYYRDRERQERALAGRATSPAIAAIHRDMADRYAELALQAKPADQRHATRRVIPGPADLKQPCSGAGRSGGDQGLTIASGPAFAGAR